LICTNCRRVEAPESKNLLCPSCNQILIAKYSYQTIKERIREKGFDMWRRGIWKYFELLPVFDENNIVSLGEGGTYLHRCERLSNELRIRQILLKNETTNPTGAFTDRGVAVAVSKAKELGFYSVCCGTTGNIGASLAAYAAKAGLDCTIFIPPTIELGKLYQMIAYGSRVESAKSYKEAQIKAKELAETNFLISSTNPYFLEGIKTTGYEICEQLGWRTPDRIVLPMGSGGHISMIWKAIKELFELDLLKHIDVKLVGVQFAEAAPIATSFLSGKDHVEASGRMSRLMVDIGIEEPSLGRLAIQALKESNGTAVILSHKEILEAMSLLAKMEGVFAEPAAASTIAGVKKLIEDGSIDKDEEIVCVITGSGLKDPITARGFVERVKSVDVIVRRLEEHKFTVKLGLTKMRILSLIRDSELHGYGIWKELSRRFRMDIKIPSVYQHLSELERAGLITRTHTKKVLGRPSRWYYSLTAKGKEVLDKWVE
ncbi:MAG: threonine synthase, partial [Nitrososphaerales archaeon]|nr:threonine synthase [Nitrososphaerales archaeon]